MRALRRTVHAEALGRPLLLDPLPCRRPPRAVACRDTGGALPRAWTTLGAGAARAPSRRPLRYARRRWLSARSSRSVTAHVVGEGRCGGALRASPASSADAGK